VIEGELGRRMRAVDYAAGKNGKSCAPRLRIKDVLREGQLGGQSMSTCLYKRAGAAARAAGSWWADYMGNSAHAAWNGNGVPGKINHANLLGPAFGNSKDVISRRGPRHKGGREKSRRCMAETTEQPELPERTD
jgi:hypothetical protein